MHVLITGASSGIGAALAREYARHGAHLTLVARRREALESLAAECEGRAFVHVADLMRLDACAQVVAAARAAHGPIDVLMNNAGVQYVESALGVSDARAEALFALNEAGVNVQSDLTPRPPLHKWRWGDSLER